jgi:hypothetical protein
LRTNPAALQIGSQTLALLLERQPHKAHGGRDAIDEVIPTLTVNQGLRSETIRCRLVAGLQP